MVCHLLVFTYLVGLCRAATKVISEPGCPVLEPVPPDECPNFTPTVNCADVLGGAGELCEGDGECGTSGGLNNCVDSSNPVKENGDENRAADVYRVAGGSSSSEEDRETRTAPEPAAPAAEGQKTIVCVGDSITFGEHGGDIEGDPELEAAGPTYPAHLASDLNVADPSHFRVVNLGRSGATAMLETDRPYREEPQFETLKATEFDYAFIMLGTNDAKTDFWDRDKFISDYKALIEEIQAMRPDARIALGIPPAYLCGLEDCEEAWKDVPGKKCCAKTTWGGKSDNHINYELPAIVQQIAEDLGVETIDFNLDFAEYDGEKIIHVSPELYNDAIHPNEVGYAIMAFDVARRVLSWAGAAPEARANLEALAPPAPVRRPEPAEATLKAWAPALLLYALPLSLVVVFVTRRGKRSAALGAGIDETLPLKYLPPEMFAKPRAAGLD